MSRRQIATSIILAALCIAATGVSLYAVFIRGDLGAALSGAVFLLALAQMVAYFSRVTAKQNDSVIKADIMQAIDAIARDLSVLRNRFGRIEHQKLPGANTPVHNQHNQVSSLRESLADMKQIPATGGRDVDGSRSEPNFVQAKEAEFPQLFLEPIVRVATGKTAYYRASLRPDIDQLVKHSSLPIRGRAIAVFEYSAPVIRRLQSRNRAVGLFCPVDALALADENFISRLVQFVEANADVAGSLVIDISQATLAKLGEKGQLGLAHLAQLGATFSLSRCRLDVPDLAALSALGFAFIDADANSLIAARRNRPCPAGDMLGEARRLGMSLIAANVETQSEVDWLQDNIELARGRHFSPPASRAARHHGSGQSQGGCLTCDGIRR